MHLSVTSSSTEISLGAHPSIALNYPFIDKISILLSLRVAIPCWFWHDVTCPRCQCNSVGVQDEGELWPGSLLMLMTSKAQLFLPVTLSWLPVCLWQSLRGKYIPGVASALTTSWLKRMAWDWDRPWHLFFCQNPILLLSSIHWCLSVALPMSFPGRQRNFLV